MALHLTPAKKRAAFVRYQLENQGLPVDEAPNDEDARQTYNFPPGAYGLVYRADVPDTGLRDAQDENENLGSQDDTESTEQTGQGSLGTVAQQLDAPPKSSQVQPTEFKYQLKTMKWGLVPFWTKRSPDYTSMLRTINCRSDSLLDNRGMWNTMKQRKRCIVIAQGFFEWLKKDPAGKNKVPHFVKRKDGLLMCFAGLWDCVKYEDSQEKLYSYTIITTESNKQLNFLHDRMPVILNAGSEEMRVWLDPTRNKWTQELQSLLKPFEGELECYPVDQAVGKVGNNSPTFIVPVDSKENKKNIANFFDNAAAKKTASLSPTKKDTVKIEKEPDETRKTVDHEGTENNAPIPVPKTGEKRGRDAAEDAEAQAHEEKKVAKAMKTSPIKANAKTTRSATSNAGMSKKIKSPVKKDGSQAITNFFGK